MKNAFGKVVYEVIEKADIILEVLDARFIEETRNPLVEAKIAREGKVLVHVINKCDHVDKRILDKKKRSLSNCIFISAQKHLGMTKLRERIGIIAKRNKLKKPLIGVIGYPNVGKSSLINALRGKGSARTSPEPGFTKGKQWVKINKDMMMIDTPGVMPPSERNEMELALVGAKNAMAIDDPDIAVYHLIQRNPLIVEHFYGVIYDSDPEKVIAAIAEKLNMKIKGNQPDIERASRKILSDWQKGKIRK